MSPEQLLAHCVRLDRRTDVYSLGEAFYELGEGNVRRAVAVFERILDMEGGSPEAATGLSPAHLKLGERDAARGVA
jgi:hypothetical protein